MARYTGAVCRLCRREGTKLYLKGDRCYSDKCSMKTKKAQAPGQHGLGRKKLSEYGLQLREKQKAKRYYGVLEKQFRHYFELAEKKKGITGENLLGILETRLDNVAYRLGFGASRAEARQIVRHGHITVNGRRVNIPSYLVSVGDVIAVAEKSKGTDSMKALLESTSGKAIVKWLDLNKDTAEAKVIAAPARDDIDIEIAEHLIVELYSK